MHYHHHEHHYHKHEHNHYHVDSSGEELGFIPPTAAPTAFPTAARENIKHHYRIGYGYERKLPAPIDVEEHYNKPLTTGETYLEKTKKEANEKTKSEANEKTKSEANGKTKSGANGWADEGKVRRMIEHIDNSEDKAISQKEFAFYLRELVGDDDLFAEVPGHLREIEKRIDDWQTRQQGGELGMQLEKHMLQKGQLPSPSSMPTTSPARGTHGEELHLRKGALMQAMLGSVAGIMAVLLMLYWCCAGDTVATLGGGSEEGHLDSALDFHNEAMMQDGVVGGESARHWSEANAAEVHKEIKAAQEIYSMGIPAVGVGGLARGGKKQGEKSSTGELASVTGSSPLGSPSRVSFDVDERGEKAKAGARAEKEDQWKINCTRMKMGRLIDRGSFGIVYEGTYNGMKVAVKKLIQQKKDKIFKRETTALKNLHHANIVRLVGTCADPDSSDADGQPLGLCIVMEHCRRLSLRHVLDDSAKYPELRWSLRLRLLLGAARGMAVLHTRQPRVLHHDLKASNILVSDDWEAKVGSHKRPLLHFHTTTPSFGLRSVSPNNLCVLITYLHSSGERLWHGHGAQGDDDYDKGGRDNGVGSSRKVRTALSTPLHATPRCTIPLTISSMFPQLQLQRCLRHLLRRLRFRHAHVRGGHAVLPVEGPTACAAHVQGRGW
jgi:hypothetical protein